MSADHRPPSPLPFLVYGANGFTGNLIVERARARGLPVIVAGRNREAVEAVGRTYGYEARVFSLDAPDEAASALKGVSAVLHAAGPYSKTSRPMVDACLRAGVHYLDITGEYQVIDATLARDAEARTARVVLLPAVGFDVVPTDCMAAKLHGALPDATRLELAFSGGMAASPGTAKTAVEGLHLGALVREGGRITTLKAPRTREVPFARGTRFCMSIPWGDLASAYVSTGIPNVTVYTVVPKKVAQVAPLLRFVAPVLRAPKVIELLQAQAEKRAPGPTASQRKTKRMSVWGRVENASGQAAEGQLDVPEGYELTVLSSLAAVERVRKGDVSPGATTPSRAFGADFVKSLEGVGAFTVTRTA